MKTKIMWAIVDIETDELALDSGSLRNDKPLLYSDEKEIRAMVGTKGRVVKVEIREVEPEEAFCDCCGYRTRDEKEIAEFKPISPPADGYAFCKECTEAECPMPGFGSGECDK